MPSTSPVDFEALYRELAAPHQHPDISELRDDSGQVVDWLLQHFATLPQQPIGMTGSPGELQSLLGEGPPEQGLDFKRVLGEFQEKVAPYAFRVNHPRFLAFIPGAPNF